MIVKVRMTKYIYVMYFQCSTLKRLTMPCLTDLPSYSQLCPTILSNSAKNRLQMTFFCHFYKT
jgi:hypothetical protein